MSEKSKHQAAVPAWKIWANPIVLRYARSRLRITGFGVHLMVVMLIAGFIFFAGRAAGVHQLNFDAVGAARGPIIPLLVLQGIVLFLLGTGQVAGGMTAESDEGVLDYQRLAPMTPLAKVMGYLFGLSIREWALFLATMPFTIVSVVQGEVSIRYFLQLYAVFVMAAILYHLTGLVAGTVMKNKRWAFLASMGMVFLLYTVIPQAAKFGLVYFKYLTIYPVLEEVLPFLIESRVGMVMEGYQQLVPSAKFFGLNLPQYVFTLISQAVLSFAMGLMLWRRWRKNDCHLLGKFSAVAIFAWLQAVLLGNSLPLINQGDVFPSREFDRRFGRFLETAAEGWSPAPTEALVMVGLYGLVTLFCLWAMIVLITPGTDDQMRGWRRARKFGKTRLPPLWDSATSTPWTVMMAAMGVGGWYFFAKSLMESRWYPGLDLTGGTLIAMVLVIFGGGLSMQALLEAKGKKYTGVTVLLVGMVPVMIAVIVGLNSDRLIPAAIWLAGMCPLLWPVYGAYMAIPVDDMPRDFIRAAPNAFWFWQGVVILLSGWLLVKLRESRKAIAEASKE